MTHINDNDDGIEFNEQDLIDAMCVIVTQLGWVMSLPISDDYITVSGLIVGNMDYVIKNSNTAYGENNNTEQRYEIFQTGKDGNMEVVVPFTSAEKKGIMH